MKLALKTVLILFIFFLIFVNPSNANEENECTCAESGFFNIDLNKCEPVQEILLCTDNYDPYCGCDGRVYSNLCDLSVNGIKSYKKGFCEIDKNFEGVWRVKGNKKHFRIKLSISDGVLSGFINGRKIKSENNLMKSKTIVSIEIKMKNKEEKDIELNLLNEKELSVRIDGKDLKARRVR